MKEFLLYKQMEPEKQQEFLNWLEKTEWSSRHSLKRKLESGYFTDWQDLLILEVDGEVAGYLAMVKEDEGVIEYSPYMAYVYMNPKFRGQNLPAMLIDEAGKYLKNLGFHKIYLITGHENYYQRHGFTPEKRVGEKQEILFWKEI